MTSAHSSAVGSSAAEPGQELPASMAELGHELGRQSRMMHMLRSHMSEWAPGLDWATFGLLMTLLKCGPLRQGELAEMTMHDPSTVSRHCSQLVKSGLVSRQPDPADGRAVQLVATPEGEALGQELMLRRQELVASILVDWSAADTETLLLLLRRLNDGLERRLTGDQDTLWSTAAQRRTAAQSTHPPPRGHSAEIRSLSHEPTQEN
jgi:DNA-binding MarR family transcriptional regulator